MKVMEISKPFGHEGEPELQKMVPFLRQRCEKGKYGLEYLDLGKTHIRIPWPTVPRANEELAESFEMFTEWAYLSFRKRGNKNEQLQNEPLSAQKHRFRNALGRADGLKYVKELSSDNIRVYEFADTKKDKENHDNGNQRNVENGRTYTYYKGENLNAHTPPQDFSDSRSTVEYNEWENIALSPSTIPTTHCQTTVQHQMVDTPNSYHSPPGQQPDMYEDFCDPVNSLSSLFDYMLNEPAPEVPVEEYTANGHYDYPMIQDQTMGNQELAPLPPQPAYQTTPNHLVPQTARMNNVQTSYYPPPDHHVLVKVMYRGEEAMKLPITNPTGFRFYSGNNVPDMSRLLDHVQRNQLAQLTRFQCEELYGPDSFQQVAMPSVTMMQSNQFARTKQILDNMDRGLVFYVEQNNSMPVPNVYTIRLCQTRVFPFETNVAERESLRDEGLKRMTWAKIFDAVEFLQSMDNWKNRPGPAPITTIKCSVGQKPRMPEENLVSLSITVAKAQAMVDHLMEDLPEEICISSKNSMDVAAQMLQRKIQSSIRLEDDNSLVRY